MQTKRDKCDSCRETSTSPLVGATQPMRYYTGRPPNFPHNDSTHCDSLGIACLQPFDLMVFRMLSQTEACFCYRRLGAPVIVYSLVMISCCCPFFPLSGHIVGGCGPEVLAGTAASMRPFSCPFEVLGRNGRREKDAVILSLIPF